MSVCNREGTRQKVYVREKKLGRKINKLDS